MEYTVIHVNFSNYKKLIEEVNKYIQAGWTPVGGVAAVGGDLMQAMVRNQP